MKRALYFLANVLGGVVLVLLLLDPTRPLGLVFVLLGAGRGLCCRAQVVAVTGRGDQGTTSGSPRSSSSSSRSS
jgi:hypothetical protein